MNEHAKSTFREPAEERVQAFVTPPARARLLRHREKSRGRDVQAACGQLVRPRMEMAAGA